MSRMLIRASAGDGDTAGAALAPMLAAGPAEDAGAADGDPGFHAPVPSSDGAKTTFTSSRATFVA